MRYVLAFIVISSFLFTPLGDALAGEMKKRPMVKSEKETVPKKEMKPPSMKEKTMEKKEQKKSVKAPTKKPSIRPLLDKRDVKLKTDPYVSSEKNKQREDNERFKTGDVKVEKQKEKVMQRTSAPVQEYSKKTYEAALNSGKLVALYFYANWCPICKEEFPKMEDAFKELPSDKVVGIRVNYNDNETDDGERALAKEFGVAYQHTKVFLKNKERVLKSPEGWDKTRYLTEVGSYLGQ